MFKDRVVIWVLEYIIGGMLVLVPLVVLGFWWVSWTDTSLLAVGLFVICLGVILLSCASSMRQRMLLARRIDALAERVTEAAASL